jgi:hypothetical protein
MTLPNKTLHRQKKPLCTAERQRSTVCRYRSANRQTVTQKNYFPFFQVSPHRPTGRQKTF